MQEYQRRKREDEKILEMARKAREEEMMLANKLTEAEKYRIKERVSLSLKLLYEKLSVCHSLHLRFKIALNISVNCKTTGVLFSAC